MTVIFGQAFAYSAFSDSHFSTPGFGVWLDRFDRAFGLAHPAVDALVPMDNEHVLALIEAINRAHLDAVHKLTTNTAIVDDVGQLGSPPAEIGRASCRERVCLYV